MDHFGTVYSSLGYLHILPLQALQVDQSFVHRLDSKNSAEALCCTIVSMGKNLGLCVSAAGVGTATQHEMRVEPDVNEVRGYHIHGPLPASDVAWLLAQQA